MAGITHVNVGRILNEMATSAERTRALRERRRRRLRKLKIQASEVDLGQIVQAGYEGLSDHDPTPALTRTLSLSPLKEDQSLDSPVKFSVAPWLRGGLFASRFEDDLRLRPLH